MQIKKTKKIRGGSNFLNEKKKYNKIVGIAPKRVSGPALHKYNPGIYIIYVWIYCISRTKKCGYGRMVKFLFAKEKTRVRFPLSAQK
jgi:hypothetical protein